MRRLACLSIVSLAALAIAASVLGEQNQGRSSGKHELDPAVVKAINGMGADLEKLNESHRNLMAAVNGLNDLYLKLVRKVQEVARLETDAKKTRGKATDKLFRATEEMQEMQMSFNLQYLMLQNKISEENRQFSMVSNIMKNKHETAKNSINNIR